MVVSVPCNCRSVEIPGAVSVSSVVPVEGSDLLLVLVGCRACLVHRETGGAGQEMSTRVQTLI